MQDSWPSAEHEAQRASPLPRVEDLPYAEHGYEPERVREAFDAFYRHLARLDATLRTVEAVEVFRDQAGELRKELRALRTAGWTQQPWLPSYSAREQVRPGLPEAVFRWAVEACFVIAVPVVAAVADLRPLWIIAAAAGAFAIVAIAEWAASRERDVLPSPAPAPAAPAEEEPPPALPAPAPAEPAVAQATAWTLPPRIEEPEEVEEPAEPAEAAEPEEAVEAEEHEEELTVVDKAEAEEVEPAPEAEEAVGEAPRRRWLLRRRRLPEPVPEPEAAPEPEAEPEPAVEPEEPEPEAVAEAPAQPPEESTAEEPPRRRRFSWRRPRVEEEQDEAEPDEDRRPKHVRVLPVEVESRVEPLDPWEEELDVEPEPDAEHEPTHRG
jgi:hypothetical protein